MYDWLGHCTALVVLQWRVAVASQRLPAGGKGQCGDNVALRHTKSQRGKRMFLFKCNCNSSAENWCILCCAAHKTRQSFGTQNCTFCALKCAQHSSHNALAVADLRISSSTRVGLRAKRRQRTTQLESMCDSKRLTGRAGNSVWPGQRFQVALRTVFSAVIRQGKPETAAGRQQQ